MADSNHRLVMVEEVADHLQYVPIEEQPLTLEPAGALTIAPFHSCPLDGQGTFACL